MMSTIMVVDDEKDILFVLDKMLKKEGYEVILVESGEAALEMLKDTKPDLILLDVMMPGLDGWETGAKIKSGEDTKNITIAMLTAKTSDDDKIKSLEDSLADWHISKPLDRAKLIDTVKWLLGNPPRRDS
jgi:DNA-binding response OmpR family regulator